MEEIKVGQTVTRWLAGTIPMELRVSEVTDDRIICGGWEFDKTTGAEIDEDLGWGPPPCAMTGSYIKMPGVTYTQAEGALRQSSRWGGGRD
jgi:hypothetical protein